jgi:hypothetical protein
MESNHQPEGGLAFETSCITRYAIFHFGALGGTRTPIFHPVTVYGLGNRAATKALLVPVVGLEPTL